MRTTARLSLSLTLLFCLGASAFADTIRLKDGTTVRGQIVGFKDQQFTVLMGTGERGRRSRMMIYMEDVESIEFESSAAGTTTAMAGTMNAPSGQQNPATSAPNTTTNTPAPPTRQQQQPERIAGNTTTPRQTHPPQALRFFK
ncbi:MAG: hypothetical protein WKF30_16900 [Pyrinomonadaceae bacterium]